MRVRAQAHGAGGIGGKKGPLPGVRGEPGDRVWGGRGAASGLSQSPRRGEPFVGKWSFNHQFTSRSEPGNRRGGERPGECRRGRRARIGCRAHGRRTGRSIAIDLRRGRRNGDSLGPSPGRPGAALPAVPLADGRRSGPLRQLRVRLPHRSASEHRRRGKAQVARAGVPRRKEKSRRPHGPRWLICHRASASPPFSP